MTETTIVALVTGLAAGAVVIALAWLAAWARSAEVRRLEDMLARTRRAFDELARRRGVTAATGDRELDRVLEEELEEKLAEIREYNRDGWWGREEGGGND